MEKVLRNENGESYEIPNSQFYIRRIIIKKLFGIYDYDLKFQRDVTLIHGLNGLGKTTILKLIDAALWGKIVPLIEVAYGSIEITLDNEVKIHIVKLQDRKPVEPRQVDRLAEILPVSDLESINNTDPQMRKPIQFAVYYKGKTLFCKNLPTNHSSCYNIDEKLNDEDDEFRNLHHMWTALNLEKNILYVDSNRLISIQNVREYRNKLTHLSDGQQIVANHIVECVQDIQNRIIEANGEYSLLCSDLDRSFPVRVIEANIRKEKPLSRSEIERRLQQLNLTRDELVELGILRLDSNYDNKSLGNLKDVSADTLRMLTIYTEDSFTKYSVFDDVRKKLVEFSRIINAPNGFAHKKMRIDFSGKPNFVSDNGQNIPLLALSSGEKHQFILFYELIFNAERNTLVLIDEPEISLHVAWQVGFVNELIKICEASGIQAIIATHSPNIVNDHWDKTIGLGEDEADG